MHLLYRPNNFWKVHGSLLVGACQWLSPQPLSFPQLSHNDSLWIKVITKSHREQGLDLREAEELSWCLSWSNSLWQGWSCGLVHYPGGKATEPIWTVLASSDGIAYWTLKPQHSNPNPNPLANQLWCNDFLTLPKSLIIPHGLTAFFEFLMLRKKLMLDSCKMIQKHSPKFISCDNQALVGFIPIAAVAVHLRLKW